MPNGHVSNKNLVISVQVAQSQFMLYSVQRRLLRSPSSTNSCLFYLTSCFSESAVPLTAVWKQ